jgi:hypothetical protein
MSSQAWSDFLVNLREATTLLRADPTSEYAKRRAAINEAALPPPSIALTNAINKGCVLLLSGRLQAFVASLLEEFLERIDQSGVVVDLIPEDLRAQLCRCYYEKSGPPNAFQTMQAHKRYAVLWTAGVVLPAGTIKTDSLRDDKNPRPDFVKGLMQRCDVDVYKQILVTYGEAYLKDLQEYVGELIDFRNAVAHGDDAAGSWTASDVRLRMRWATRLARACDKALGAQLDAITGTGW